MSEISSERDRFVARILGNQSPKRQAQTAAMTAMRKVYVPNSNHVELNGAIDRLLDSVAVELSLPHERLSGDMTERGGRALLVDGRAGVGKSVTCQKVLDARPEFAPDENGRSTLLRFVAPSPFTVAALGNMLTDRLAYRSTRFIRESKVWPMVHRLLPEQGVRILAMDEAQHSDQIEKADSVKTIENSFKRLMQNSEWPVWWIFVGLPEIRRFFRDDDSMRRRVTVVEFQTLSFEQDVQVVKDTVALILQAVPGIDGSKLCTDEFVHRLIHATFGAFGILIEFIQDAVCECIGSGETTLTAMHFADVYAARTGALDCDNVFLIGRFTMIDVGNALYVDEVDWRGIPTGKRKPKERR